MHGIGAQIVVRLFKFLFSNPCLNIYIYMERERQRDQLSFENHEANNSKRVYVFPGTLLSWHVVSKQNEIQCYHL